MVSEVEGYKEFVKVQEIAGEYGFKIGFFGLNDVELSLSGHGIKVFLTTIGEIKAFIAGWEAQKCSVLSMSGEFFECIYPAGICIHPDSSYNTKKIQK